jgi:uncharacterized protein
MNRALAAVAIALAFACDEARDAIAPSIPDSPSTFVTDNARALSPETKRTLERRLEEYARASGHQVIVWIGESLEGQAIEDWSSRAFSAWGIGRKGFDDGAALFVFTRERRARIEVGYGLEDVLTDAQSGRILDEHLVPAMRAGDTNRAITGTLDAIIETIGGVERPVGTTPPAPRQLPLPPWLMVIVVIAIVLLIARHPWLALFLLSNLTSRGGGRGGFSGGGGRSGGGGASRGW